MPVVDKEERESSLDPVLTLQVSPSSQAQVSSVCFISKHNDDSSSSSDDDLIFQSGQLLPSKNRAQHELSNYLLASCHTSGETRLWDLQSKRSSYSFDDSETKAAGLAMSLVDGDNKLAYQTRDGRVSVFDLGKDDPKKVLEIQTGSQGFCAMSVSKGQTKSMMALPSDDPSSCTIHDIRQMDSTFHFPAGGGDADHGMLMSLSMVDPIVACGMEDGTLCFHDLRKAGGRSCSVKLSTNFIIGLDMVPSVDGSMVAVSGMAGNAEDLEDLPESERGTVAVVKCCVGPELFEASLRSRVGTCSLSGGGKPGVDVCQFRPDGRLFSIGGWDKRVRLFERSRAAPLALLKGHTASVSSLDWASNSLLASGDKAGTIHIWNVTI